MTRTRLLVLAAAAGALVATCGASSAQPPAERPGVDYPLDNVTSVCDQFGHRVYRYKSGNAGSIAVVPNDVSCVKAPIR